MEERKSMQEIHEIMEKLYKKRKKMNRTEIVEDIHTGAKELIRRYGLKIEKASSKVTVRNQPII
ncbi:MAG: hypothetical protein AAB332_04565 [Planctomycetota bacterium]